MESHIEQFSIFLIGNSAPSVAIKNLTTNHSKSRDDMNVTNLEDSRFFSEKGIPQESKYFWNCPPLSESFLSNKPELKSIQCTYSAFTLDEILEILPIRVNNYYWLQIHKIRKAWAIGYMHEDRKQFEHAEIESFLLQAASKMLIYILENNLFEVRK